MQQQYHSLNNIMSTSKVLDDQCAACGKESDGLKTCNSCKSVKYCNVSCQKAHRKQHVHECKKRAAELLEEALFKQPPPRKDCAICMHQLPIAEETVYKSCCGTTICTGCIYGQMEASGTKPQRVLPNLPCPFCRLQMVYSYKESIDRYNKRMELGDADAFFTMGTMSMYGEDGVSQDTKKALELYLRAVELGSIEAHNKIGILYSDGKYLPKDSKKMLYHYQQGAMKGCEYARYHIGVEEYKMGKMDRAMKHWVIGATIGHKGSLDNVKAGFTKRVITKAQYENALRGYHAYIDEAKSEKRDKVAPLIQRDKTLTHLKYDKNRTRK